MSDADESTTPPRVGSTADLARRLDRVEHRQDTLEGKVDSLSATVGRLEVSAGHASELSKLRFDAIETNLSHGFEEAGRRWARIEAIISGEVVTPQTKMMLDQYQNFVESSTKDRIHLNQRVSLLESANGIAEARSQGILSALGGLKGVVLLLAAIASPIITVVVTLVRN